ncbi:hypothetical protein [Wenyingzhuangia sp. 2_MG-2023]|uniref:hypothetical protein n=1 Tax=Wenyingzhuangia sp. 2_MG-2023 TaxID=3062639 RepID=UPI0026E4954E|nr:hypothetical protein [Wenyingzhuangia sp. 2_MG-2023]MDO6739389.1 hypothetical protein [Wenyingzhuangia sp. 2_MG-2023]
MGRPKKYSKYEEQNESEFKKHWLKKLEQHFTIEEEVSGIHITGKKLRIDAIIKPKDTSDWKNKNIVFGLEFKSPTKIDRLNNQLNYMRQCVDYSYTKFGDYGFIPILSCPQFELDETYSTSKALKTLKHFLNTFNVGELGETYRGYSILFADSYIWSSGKVELGKRWLLKKKIGS